MAWRRCNNGQMSYRRIAQRVGSPALLQARVAHPGPRRNIPSLPARYGVWDLGSSGLRPSMRLGRRHDDMAVMAQHLQPVLVMMTAVTVALAVARRLVVHL